MTTFPTDNQPGFYVLDEMADRVPNGYVSGPFDDHATAEADRLERNIAGDCQVYELTPAFFEKLNREAPRCKTCGTPTPIACDLCGICAEDWNDRDQKAGRGRIDRRRKDNGLAPLPKAVV